jgi:hypothetical protein
MELARLTRGSSLVLVSVALIVSCTSADPPASTTAPVPLQGPEAVAWTAVRSSHPAVPIIVPTWLPPTVDRTRAELRELVRDPANPSYAIAYVASSGATVLLALGPATDVAGSGVGTRVRNSPAVLSFSSDLWSDPSKPSLRRLRWMEGRYVLRIESERFTGEDLLHVAWSLDPTGAPAPANQHARVKIGVCAAQGAPPEETVRRLLSSLGTGDRDAAADCFSLDVLGQSPVAGGWADLPRASEVELSQPSALAGRFVVGVSWLFATQPDGPWSLRPHMFFALGLEDGRWRIYEGATAPIGPPP